MRLRTTGASPQCCVRRLVFGAPMFRFPFAGASWVAGFPTFANKNWIAVQVCSKDTFRFVNFIACLSEVNGATPAKLFQISTGRVQGHEASNLVGSWDEPRYSAL